MRRSLVRAMTDLEPWLPVFPGLIPAEAAIEMAELGTHSPEWAALCNAAYPESVGLWALACREELRVALMRAGICGCKRVLDAGCGPGVISRILLDVGAREVIGVDNHPRMLEAARRGPLCAGRARQVRFVDHDLIQPLPFEDGAFDAVFMGDCWSHGMLREVKRVLRPGGRLIVKWANPLLNVTYAWDSHFEARVQLAYLHGVARHRSRAHAHLMPASFFGQMRLHGFSRVWTVQAERFAPAPDAFVLSQCHSFGMWFGPFIRENADANDWAALRQLYNPRSNHFLFNRADGHFIRTFIMAVAVVEDVCAAPGAEPKKTRLYDPICQILNRVAKCDNEDPKGKTNSWSYEALY